ncbi:HKD family nuclease [Duganella sp. SG902]|uniref:phospholipase D family protein n=1 Tax=Duganella sp. SG902 TaxID=2587016 RepID=UPI00159DC165|nr:phospholipase D family protein [Duganella sp. SG902]NVM80186.1 HKD family nuclease [Duganella sp. SG902]
MIVTQNAMNPAAIRNAIADLIPNDASDMRLASAYMTRSGCNLLLDAVYDSVGRDAFQLMPKLILTSFDFGLTEPQALRIWQGTPNTTILVSGFERLQQRVLAPVRAFHPKLYSFGWGNGWSCNALIGSANLTGRGFSVNTEVASAQWGVPRGEIDAAFATMSSGSTILTDQLLADYEVVRQYQRPPEGIAQEIEAVPQPPAPVAGTLALFRQAIESGAVDPARFSSMWLQGEALQGGSHNQLELPRGGHRFFGFHFNQYDYPHNLHIGTPVLRSGQKAWHDRPLTWHGNNRMERINLPTLYQGGFNYVGTAVMFRRLMDGSFELIVTPWDSDLARSWRIASSERHTLFRLGAIATSRIVGLI